MTTTKHTPGPWQAHGVHVTSTRSNGSSALDTIAGAYGLIGDNGEIQKANARLMAASPILLAACQTAFDALESAAATDATSPQAKALAQLRTAIYTAIP